VGNVVQVTALAEVGKVGEGDSAGVPVRVHRKGGVCVCGGMGRKESEHRQNNEE
jgi:hypothetical protein